MIDETRQLLFIHIARTGGTSIETALMGKDWWIINQDTKHISASQARQIYGEDVWLSFRKFSSVRNPWDRVVSMWATGWWAENQIKAERSPPPSFRDFVLGLTPHPNERYNSLQYHEILDEKLDFIIRFESIQADFSAMLKKFDLPDLVLPHVEQRTRDHYRTYFDDETASLVAAMFEKDISNYGYVF